MSSFEIKTAAVLDQCNRLEQVNNRMGQLIGKGNTCRTQISKNLYSVSRSLSTVLAGMEKEQQEIQQLKRSLQQIAELYSQADYKVANGSADYHIDNRKWNAAIAGIYSLYQYFRSFLIKLFPQLDKDNSYEMDNIITRSNSGGYGGNQGSAQNTTGERHQELVDVVQKYFPDMSDQEASEYLEKMNSEGCAYTAIVNTIFAYYSNHPSAFERKFGFPMYDENGNPNYDRMITDIYCMTDNHNDANGQDYYNPNEDPSSTTGSGCTEEAEVYRAEMYFKHYGIHATARTIDNITPENLDRYLENGYVIINDWHGNLDNADGSFNRYVDGGHAMMITGKTADGKYIVSTWGRKMCIDPDEIVEKYCRRHNSSEKTENSYVYVQFNEPRSPIDPELIR